MAKILLVDDEKNILKLSSFLLKSMGHNVLTAENGLTALELIKKNKDIALIISDYLMPELNGLELAAKAPKHKMIIASATSSDLSKKTSCKNIIGFIEKPFEIATLKRSVTEALALEI